MRRRRRKALPGRAAIVFATTFAALAALGSVAIRRSDLLAFARREVPAVPVADQEWDIAFAAGRTHLDHAILWHGIGPAIEHARRADVLFVGSSQMQFALPPHELRQFERRTGLSAFSLALPFAETYEFPLALIEKFDLRPRVVVAAVNGFFRSAASMQGQLVRRDAPWAARRTVWEERLAALVWPPASRVLPSFATKRPSWALLRSSRDGTWLPVNWASRHVPVSSVPKGLEWDVRAAFAFAKALRARGVQLVLTCVPSALQACAPPSLMPLAFALGVPFVSPRVDAPLWTTDLVHLCPLSGKRFGRALLRDLGDLPVLRATAREPSVRRTAR